MDTKEKFQNAFDLFKSKKYEEALPLFEELVASGNYDAMFHAGLCWDYMDGDAEVHYAKSFPLYLKAAKEGKHPEACALVSESYILCRGVNYSATEAVRYGEMALKELKEDNKYIKYAYNALGIAYFAGEGVCKNIPLSYKYLKKADCMGEPEGLKVLLETYPMTKNGEIDLKVRKRSAWATIILFFGTIFGAGGTLSLWNLAENKLLASICAFSVITYLLIFFWSKLGGILLQVLVALGLASSFYLPHLLSRGDPSDFEIVIASIAGLFLPNLFLLLSLQIRKKGHAIAWNSLMNIPDDGRNNIKKMIDMIMLYGKGEEFSQTSPQTCQVRNILLVGLVPTVLAAVYAAWKTATSDFGFDEIEWNCFNNTGLLGFLSFIGFFVQFLPKMWVHSSYETYDVYKDEYGNIKRVEKNRDMLTTIEGNFLMPLLSHFIIYPLIIGIILYYILMGGYALLQGVMPYLLAILVLASCWPAYAFGIKCLERKYRKVLIPVSLAFFIMIYLSIGGVSISTDNPGTNRAVASDLPVYELKGKVKQVEVNTYPADKRGKAIESKRIEWESFTATFDENGVATRHRYDYDLNEGQKPKTVRDSEGRLIKYSTVKVEGDGITLNYQYDGNGNMTQLNCEAGFSGTTNYKFFYNEKGQLIKREYVANDVDFQNTTSDNITYTKYDEQGNWTERTISGISKIIGEDGNPRTEKRILVEKRKILYY